jgi:hypothetical protein
MPYKITFACKDPLIEQYFSTWGPRGRSGTTWMEKAQRQVEDGTFDPRQWERWMEKEAALQQWYDFESVDGRYVPLKDDDGKPRLLVPTVVVEETP